MNSKKQIAEFKKWAENEKNLKKTTISNYVTYLKDKKAFESTDPNVIQSLIEKGDNNNNEKSALGKFKEFLEQQNNYIPKEHSLNVIYHGAPGTGKTYFVLKNVKEKCKNEKGGWKFVQFHSSYDYSDFVEGLRPVQQKKDEAPTFVRVDGVFKEFCREIVESNAYSAAVKSAILMISPKTKVAQTIQENIAMLKTKLAQSNNEGAKQKAKNLLNGVTPYYFIVDEINRADLGKVFGELMFCLEESYRGPENAVLTQYKNLYTCRVNDDGTVKVIEKKDDVFANGFFIPENLHFIGTMNDIDRSVETFDFALRRRFQWIEFIANTRMKKSLHEMLDSQIKQKKLVDSLADKIISMNEKLTENNGFGLTRAYHIGAAYFKTFDGTINSLVDIFRDKIEPIIREYTRGFNMDVDQLVNNCRTALIEE